MKAVRLRHSRSLRRLVSLVDLCVCGSDQLTYGILFLLPIRDTWRGTTSRSHRRRPRSISRCAFTATHRGSRRLCDATHPFAFNPTVRLRHSLPRSLAPRAPGLPVPQVAEKHGLSAIELALGFVKSRWFVASTIIGATSMKQLKQDIDAFEVNLSDEVLADINTIYKKFRDPVM